MTWRYKSTMSIWSTWWHKSTMSTRHDDTKVPCQHDMVAQKYHVNTTWWHKVPCQHDMVAQKYHVNTTWWDKSTMSTLSWYYSHDTGMALLTWFYYHGIMSSGNEDDAITTLLFCTFTIVILLRVLPWYHCNSTIAMVLLSWLIIAIIPLILRKLNSEISPGSTKHYWSSQSEFVQIIIVWLWCWCTYMWYVHVVHVIHVIHVVCV